MKTLLAAALVAAAPLVTVAQGAGPSDGAPAAPAPAQDAPPPQGAPPRTMPPPPAPGDPPPQGPGVPPPEYAAPQRQDAPPPGYEDPAGYVPPPQHAPPAPPEPPRRRGRHERDSWYIGFGLHGGDGTLETSRSTYSFKRYANAWGVDRTPTTLGLNFKVGATINPRLLVGFDMSFLDSAADDGTATTTLTITNYDLMATVFPFRRGPFLRAGLGRSTLAFKVKNVRTSTGTYSGSDSLSGWNAAGGVGYAFWIGRQFNLTVNLDASEQWWSGHETLQPTRSSCVAVGAGFDWY